MSRHQKTINLYGTPAVLTWRNAEEAARRELDEPTEAEVLLEICEAYTGWRAEDV